MQASDCRTLLDQSQIFSGEFSHSLALGSAAAFTGNLVRAHIPKHDVARREWLGLQ
jgi:hypothetical protein